MCRNPKKDKNPKQFYGSIQIYRRQLAQPPQPRLQQPQMAAGTPSRALALAHIPEEQSLGRAPKFLLRLPQLGTRQSLFPLPKGKQAHGL